MISSFAYYATAAKSLGCFASVNIPAYGSACDNDDRRNNVEQAHAKRHAPSASAALSSHLNKPVVLISATDPSDERHFASNRFAYEFLGMSAGKYTHAKIKGQPVNGWRISMLAQHTKNAR